MVDDGFKDVGLPNPFGLCASTHKTIRRAKEMGAWTNEPVVGGLFGIDRGNGKGHLVILAELFNKYAIAIEGNTNEWGSREGTMVKMRSRKYDELDLGGFDPSMLLK